MGFTQEIWFQIINHLWLLLVGIWTHGNNPATNSTEHQRRRRSFCCQQPPQWWQRCGGWGVKVFVPQPFYILYIYIYIYHVLILSLIDDEFLYRYENHPDLYFVHTHIHIYIYYIIYMHIYMHITYVYVCVYVWFSRIYILAFLKPAHLCGWPYALG